MRVLIVEDREALIEEYLRIFSRVLGRLNIEFVKVSSIAEALTPIGEESWEAILMDSDLGPPAMLPPETAGGNKVRINNGYDLIRFRREMERTRKDLGRSLILGLAPSNVAANFQRDSGADATFLKLYIPQIADFLQKNLSKEAATQ